MEQRRGTSSSSPYRPQAPLARRSGVMEIALPRWPHCLPSCVGYDPARSAHPPFMRALEALIVAAVA
jgi:hypothetical protein